jgi:hypothetical protein
MDSQRILRVDRAFNPDCWVSPTEVLTLLGRGVVQTTFGETAMVLRGGINAKTGRQSIIEVGSIIVVDTGKHLVRDFGYAPYDRKLLFKRDRHMCAYCGGLFSEKVLQQEHVHPQSRGGSSSWTNLVTACHACNQKKANKTPEEAGMELLYLPYAPTRFEWLILENHRILADQMDFLMERVPKHSRLHA